MQPINQVLQCGSVRVERVVVEKDEPYMADSPGGG